MMQVDDENKRTSPIQENLKEMVDQSVKLEGAILEMLEGTERLNKVFGQTRQRATEMMKAVSDTALSITRLGGDMNDVYNTMEEISTATGKNVIANADAAARMFATSKVLQQSVYTLVDGFADVGVQFSQIDDQMEEATKYVRDMGLNTKEVMDKVVNNFKMLNSFNFEGGVQGMTKMAVKATMFRIDMGQAFRLAEDVMNPENAVKVASAFQRLGVAAGNMVDPFSLMNASINDPGALQDTIVNIGKQFTYFDEKTKSFRINPQGMLTMRELSKETGISYDELTKAGLAASELDSRLSQISPAIKFQKEEDKQFLTNISSMGEGGKYEVTLEDGTKKDLSKLNQDEFDKLIKAQKEAPKDMEDVQRAQLGEQKKMGSDVRSILDSVTRGVAATPFIRENLEGFRNISEKFLGSIAKDTVKSGLVSKNIDKVTETLRGTIKGLVKSKGGKANIDEITEQLKGQGLKEASSDVARTIAAMAEKAASGVIKLGKKENASEIEESTAAGIEQIGKILNLFKESPSNQPKGVSTNNSIQYSQSAILGGSSPTEKINNSQFTNQTLTSKISQSVDFGGTITIKVDAPPGVSVQYVQEQLNSEDLKTKISTHIQRKLQEAGLIPKTIPAK
jgi:hypothetical protein